MRTTIRVSINLYSDVWTKSHWTELSAIVEYSILSNGTNSIGQLSFPFSPLPLQRNPSLIGEQQSALLKLTPRREYWIGSSLNGQFGGNVEQLLQLKYIYSHYLILQSHKGNFITVTFIILFFFLKDVINIQFMN